MTGISTCDSVTLVESRGRGGVNIDTYRTRKDVVLGLLDNGSIADGSWGSDKHLEVLGEMERHIKDVRGRIIKFNSNEIEEE